MSYAEKMLNQVQLTTANATILYQPAKKLITRIDKIVVANYGGAVKTLSLYHDDDGATAGNTTIIMSAVPFGTGLFREIPIGIYMNTVEAVGGSLIAVAETGNFFNLTVYGVEIK